MPRWRARGLTLIEVVAAIAILGTILVGVVMAQSRLLRQLGRAERERRAVRAADDLIAGWWNGGGVPTDATGAVPGGDRLTWETRSQPNPAIEALGARVVRVRVLEAGSTTNPDRARLQPADAVGDSDSDSARDFAPEGGDALVVVDLVLPLEEAGR